MGVDVGVSDLVRSYAGQRDAAAGQEGPPGRLLAFYSVECGLKAAVLGKNGVNARSTAALPPALRTHDLRRLAKELGIVMKHENELAGCRRRHDGSSWVSPTELHEAWRYGATLNEEDEKAVDAALAHLSEWCRKEHRR
jgi:hypothetical protein